MNIKEEYEEYEEYEGIKSDLKKHIYNIYNIIRHLNNIDDSMENIDIDIDNIFDIICGTQILKNTIHEIKHINGKIRCIYPTDLLGKGKYGHNKKYDSEEEAIQKAEEISTDKKKSVFIVKTKANTWYVKVPHDGKEKSILVEIKDNIKNNINPDSRCYYIEYVPQIEEQTIK